MGLPSSPNDRKEVYLSNIAGQGTALPSEPHDRYEAYLDYIAKNGGGGGGTGDGDMKKAIYDDDLAVATAGGIADYVASAISGKVDVVSGKGLSTNDYDNTAKGIVDGVNTALDGKVSKSNTAGLLKNDGTVDQTSYATAASVTAIKDGTTIDSFGDVETALSNKVDKVSNKGLSTNDYDATAKSKLDNLANIKSIGTGLDLDASGKLTATGAELTIDSNPTQDSTNLVYSGGVFTALAGKQDTLTFDNFPTTGSTNPVTSGGIKSATTEIWGVIGPIEAGITSAHAYEVGDHFECRFGYVTVIAPIAVGDTIENNVNVVGGTIASTMTQDAKELTDSKVDWESYAKTGVHNFYNGTDAASTAYTLVKSSDRTHAFGSIPYNFKTGDKIVVQFEVESKSDFDTTKNAFSFRVHYNNQTGSAYAAGPSIDISVNDLSGVIKKEYTLTHDLTSTAMIFMLIDNTQAADATVSIKHLMVYLPEDAVSAYAPYAMTNRELTENVNNVLANMINLAFTVTSANYTGDLDELDAGIRYCTNATAHNPNNAWGYCFTIKNPSNKIQIFVAQASDGIWYRRYASSAWQAWKTVTIS